MAACLVTLTSALVPRDAPLVSPAYRELFFDQRLDHFRFDAQSSRTWKQRYLVDDSHWDRGTGPILFYTGNEGPVDAFYAASGFVTTTLAAKLGGLVIFAEQRFYGKSLPFGKDSMTPSGLSYLSTELVLADYAALLTALKPELNATNVPVISFGGSYGGTLSTLFRHKYPHVVAGALAASAPLGYYSPRGRVATRTPRFDALTWFDTVVRDYSEARDGCYTTLVDGVRSANSTARSGPAGAKAVAEAFGLCAPPTDIDAWVFWITECLESLPQIDYPYAVGSLPPLPVNATCDAVAGKSGSTLLAALGNVTSWFYDRHAQPKGCFANAVSDQVKGGVPGDGPSNASSWGYQSCTETLHPFSVPTGSWRDFTFDLAEQTAICESYYGLSPRLDWLETWGGGYGLADSVSSLTNIIWSNGRRDPWHGGGFLRASDARPGGAVIVMDHTAHHQDLRLPHPADPPELVAARLQEEALIRSWIREHDQSRNA
jgi:pimeloyl-ACP methyl ester carboxylesterase